MAKRKYKADYNRMTIDCLRNEGWVPWLVECNNGRRSRDFYGIWDFFASKPYSGERHRVVQSTTASNMAARRRKIQAHENYLWCLHEFRCELWGWKQEGGKWVPKIEVFSYGPHLR